MFPNKFLLILLLSFGKYAFCQSALTIENIIQVKLSTQPEVKQANKKPLLFRFYKNLISSQDGNSCGFYPSCSQFAAESISKKGIVIGTFAAFDRLSRCNGHNHEFYLFHPTTQKLLDLVQ